MPASDLGPRNHEKQTSKNKTQTLKEKWQAVARKQKGQRELNARDQGDCKFKQWLRLLMWPFSS